MVILQKSAQDIKEEFCVNTGEEYIQHTGWEDSYKEVIIGLLKQMLGFHQSRN